MATINLGAIKFNWKGAYNSSTSYAVDDVVSSGGNSYVCIQAHSNQAVGDATAYWNIMSSAGTNGTNGTDLTSTLTTEGDMLYRDGSGLQRLAKGTAGQELRINSGATAPEWYTPATASSDYVKIGEITGNNTSDTITMSNIFTSTYDNYRIVLFYKQSNKVKIFWNYIDSNGSVISSSSYYGIRLTAYGNSGSSSRGSSPIWGDSRIESDEFCQASTNRPAIQEFEIYKPASSGHNKLSYLKHIGFNDSSYITSIVSAEYASAGELTGLSVQTSTGDNFQNTSSVIIYGIKG